MCTAKYHKELQDTTLQNLQYFAVDCRSILPYFKVRQQVNYKIPTTGYCKIPTTGYYKIPTTGYCKIPTTGYCKIPTTGTAKYQQRVTAKFCITCLKHTAKHSEIHVILQNTRFSRCPSLFSFQRAMRQGPPPRTAVTLGQAMHHDDG